MRNREWGNHLGLPMSTESSLQVEGGIDASLWWSWYDTTLPLRRAWPSACRTWQMIGCGLRTWLCRGWALLPAWRCLFRFDPRSGKWLQAVGSRSLHWRSSPKCFSPWLVGLVTTLPGLGKDAPNDAPGHGIDAYGRELVGVVVRVVVASSGFASPSSTPMLSVGGPISRKSSPSHRRNVLMTSRSKSVRGSPSPNHGLEG